MSTPTVSFLRCIIIFGPFGFLFPGCHRVHGSSAQVRGWCHRALDWQPVVTQEQNHLGPDGEWLSATGWGQLQNPDLDGEHAERKNQTIYKWVLHSHVETSIYTQQWLYGQSEKYNYALLSPRSEKCTVAIFQQWCTGPWIGRRWSSFAAVGPGFRYLQRQGCSLCYPGGVRFRNRRCCKLCTQKSLVEQFVNDVPLTTMTSGDLRNMLICVGVLGCGTLSKLECNMCRIEKQPSSTSRCWGVFWPESFDAITSLDQHLSESGWANTLWSKLLGKVKSYMIGITAITGPSNP